MSIDPDRACTHEHFSANITVDRLQRSETDPEIVGYSADITVNCDDCGEPFRWSGVQAGVSQQRPMCSVDETELRAPLRPASADADFGMSLPGFSIRMRD